MSCEFDRVLGLKLPAVCIYINGQESPGSHLQDGCPSNRCTEGMKHREKHLDGTPG